MKHDSEFMEKITQYLEARKAAGRILDVDESAGPEEIRKAYKKAAVMYHPDHNGNSPEANRKFVLVNCAYELLTFDKSCDRLLGEIASWPGVPEEGKYRTENSWGHFLWWREKFFESDKTNKTGKHRKRSCV